MQKTLFKLLVPALIMVWWLSSCAVIPRCPTQLLPVVETKINNSSGSEDDYLSTASYTLCQARISNVNKFGGGQNFPGGVEVEIRNIQSSANLLFSTTGGADPGTNSLFVTLPANGNFFNFFVKGIAPTAVDKSAIIEIATAGASCGETVLTRAATMVPAGAAPITTGGATPVVIIQVGSVSHLDDYITWAPTACTIKWQNPPNAGASLNVTLQNMAGTSRVRFANSTLTGGNTATSSTLPITLSGSGAEVKFYIAGNFASPSVNDKDAVFEVINNSGGTLLTREAVMVRVRKNANNISVPERDRYLEALKKVNLTYNSYIDFVKTHSRNTTTNFSTVSHRQAHSGSGFLPWHRAFVLHLERLLQSADPSIALHYWKFDASASNIFSPGFMGNNSGGNMANLDGTNPIASWTLPGEGVPAGIQRNTPYNSATGNPNVATETATLGLGSPGFNYANFKSMEISAHNPAHSRSGFTNPDGSPVAGASWIGGSPAIAPRDPLFFFLHSNVDRLWAKWQDLRNRNDITNVSTYDLLGSHDAPAPGVAAPLFTQDAMTGQITANRTLGQYADDTMWPWDEVLGGTTTKARPTVSILKPFPITLAAILPFNKPTVKSVIDYLSITPATVTPGLGFGYDDFFPY